jgi:hypothetical protein
MIEKNRKTWYVGDRGELLAQLFLTELNPISVNHGAKDDLFDYTVTFAAPNGVLRLIVVEVKATEKPVKDKYPFRVDVIRRLSTVNVPVLLLVVDVKNNAIYYTWARAAAELLPQDSDKTTFPVPVKRADEHKEELLQEILGT